MKLVAWSPTGTYLPGDVAFFPGAGVRVRASLDPGDWVPLETFRGHFDPEAQYDAGDMVILNGELVLLQSSGRWAVILSPKAAT